MNPSFDPALKAMRHAAQRIPAYRALLNEAGIDAGTIHTPADFTRLPVLEKSNTFQRFGIADLCVDGDLGDLGSVLTSSGHSGVFAFGLNAAAALPGMSASIDKLLDLVFSVKTRKTLLINCLPMGVKVPTQCCTLAETSVRPDMAIGLVKAFGLYHAQIIFVGEAAFIKHTLELGARAGIDWKKLTVHIILGEEPLAENARKYFELLLATDLSHPEKGLIASSMGVGEIGLNLFFEVPPTAPLIALRRMLHEHPDLRRQVFGDAVAAVPSIFTYDPGRIFVEFDDAGRLLLTTLEPHLRVPLVRYATGDCGGWLRLPEALRAPLEALGIPWGLFENIPVVAIRGRGEHALAGSARIYPEDVKEGLYHAPALAAQLTANFRIVSGPDKARVRVQLSPQAEPAKDFDKRLHAAIACYVRVPFEVVCEPYEAFTSGMALDYERKFAYLSIS